jgi:deoxyribodipyrimidine photo-lyase
MLDNGQSKLKINLVWLKRDLRTQDHEPLFWAEQSDLPYLILYFFEPSVLAHPDTSLRHLQFQYQSILHINKSLSKVGKCVHIFHSEVLTVLEYLLTHYDISSIFSYQESGVLHTYNRDKMLANFLKKNHIAWKQAQRDGIIRGVKNRNGWDKAWYAAMSRPIIENTYSQRLEPSFKNHWNLNAHLFKKISHYPSQYQPAGEEYAFKYLTSFVEKRASTYSRFISKPLESRTSCARISVYLSWGNISIKQVYQYVLKYKSTVKPAYSFTAFLSRLKWHCHFIQKFEVECTYETHCINSGYEYLEHPKDNTKIRAWQSGLTGFPLLDACMRCLVHTGWLNFRMRAMLVSFFCHHLYQDWRDGVYYLAKLFLDYEPGIHYPQFQMQAGTTGINTIRIYNPLKQSEEHDPNGTFIKKWLPELALVSTEFIHQPHLMNLEQQIESELIIGKDYPLPIIDLSESGKYAREKIWGHRKHEKVQAENKRILHVHTRAKSQS